MPMTESANNIQERIASFQRDALASTLEHVARHVPYYQRLPHLAIAGRTPTLEDFPICGQDVVRQHPWAFVALDRFPDYVLTTGGTSGGDPIVTFRDEHDYRAGHELFSSTGGMQAASESTPSSFALDIFFNSNGYYWRKAPGWPVMSVVLERRAHADFICEMIRRGIRVSGRQTCARRVVAQNGPFRALTGYFCVRGFLPREHGMEGVTTYGSHVSRVWKDRIESIWGCRPGEVYGLTEFAVGNAQHCPHCSAWHYWTAWPEFLAPSCLEFIDRGDAELLLTSFLPFARIHPRVRYRTGDLVTVMGPCPATGLPGFRFRGRVTASVLDPASTPGRVLMSEIDLLEVLDRLPDLSAQAHPSECAIWSQVDLPQPPFRIGHPRFRIRPGHGAAHPSISVEVSFDPVQEPARADTLHTQIVQGLRIDSPLFAERLDQGAVSLKVELLPPGTLDVSVKSAA